MAGSSRGAGIVASAITLLISTASCASDSKQASAGRTVTVFPGQATLPPSGQQAFSATVTGDGSWSIVWSVRQGAAGGSITPEGLYTAPPSEGAFHVIATEPASGVSGEAAVTVSSGCWQLPAVDRVRVFPRTGQAAAMAGGTIQGSNDSATNGFTVLATLQTAPAEGQWTELTFANPVPYRWVKYYGPSGSYGQIAELELYHGTTRVTGAGFGTAGSRSGNPWQNALDGDTNTFLDGPISSDVYVGLDLADGHVTATPAISPAGGSYSSPQAITLSSATPGATIRFTTDGSDPANGAVYNAPFQVGAGTTTVRATASKECMANSAGSAATFTIGGGTSSSQSTLHVGNSLTDTIDGWLVPVTAAGGLVDLDYARYTVPGIGTWVYHDQPTGGFGVPNVQVYVQTKRLDHVSFQPHPNMPCLPTGGDATPGTHASDATNIDQAWDDAVIQNPDVQMWVMEVWPPVPSSSAFLNCMTGGSWLRDPSIWNPPPPSTWEDASRNVLSYDERVREGLIAMNPGRPAPYIIPTGRGLAKVKAAVDAGTFPGVASGSFFTIFYNDETHLKAIGRYFVTLVFYAVMFQADPRALPDTNLGTSTALTTAQAAALQQIAYDTVSGYPLSGFVR